MDTAINITKYFNVDLKLLTEKTEGDTLPFMDNKKIIQSSGHNYFSNHSKSLIDYLSKISN